MDHHTDPLICTLLDTANDALLALENTADDAEARGDLQAAHFARHRVDALDKAIGALEWRRIASMSEAEVVAELAEHGISTDDVGRGVDFVRELCRAHKEASRRAAELKCKTMADVDGGDPAPGHGLDDEPFGGESDPTDIARFELDMVDVYIGDLWRAVFGLDKPMPNSGTTRLQALSRIMGMCLRVEWPHTRQQRPKLRLLPVGVEADDEGPG